MRIINSKANLKIKEGVKIIATDTIEIRNSEFNNNGRGGLHIENSSSVRINNSMIYANQDASAVNIRNTKKLRFENNTVRRNINLSNITSGGGMDFNNIDSIFVIGSVIDSNKSNYGGGGLSITNTDYVYLHTSKILKNESDLNTNNTPTLQNFRGGCGMKVFNQKSITLNILHSTFGNNVSDTSVLRYSNGGGIKLSVEGDSIVSQLNIDYSTFHHNLATFGASIVSETQNPTTTSKKAHCLIDINHSTFTQNVSEKGYQITTWAGGQTDNKANISILNSTLYNNKGISKALYAGYTPTANGTSEIEIQSSILVNNDTSNFESDTVISLGYNVLSESSLLGSHPSDQFNIDSAMLLLDTLKNNGSLTPTLIPKTGSVTINGGNPSDLTDAQNGPILDSRRDIGACEVGAGVGIEETKLSKDDVLLFPNPTSHITTIRFKHSISKASISLYDLTGKVVLNVNSNNSSDVVLDTQYLRPGIYFVKIHEGNDYITKRLVKQ